MSRGGSKQWYVLHTYTGHERKVEQRIRLQFDVSQEGSVISEVVVPAEKITEVRDGKKRIVTNIFLQGYLLLEMNLDDTNWQDICRSISKVEGVTGFAGAQYGKKPYPITKEEASSILQRVGLIKGGSKVESQDNYMEGETVRILEGPFESFTGSIDEIDMEKGKMRVSVGIFGRTTPVEVDILEVERV